MKSIICIFAAISVAFCGCGVQYRESSFIAMDTYMTLKIDGAEQVLEDTEKLIMQISDKLDINDANSAASALNSSGSTNDEQLVAICALADGFARQTDGAFNYALCDLKTLWNINSEMTEIPSAKSILTALNTSNYSNISVENKGVLLNGARVDFGGIAKGYACDESVRLLKENGVSSGILSLGGSIALLGDKQGSDWSVAITDPCNENGRLGVLELTDCFVSTSGDYQRYGTVDGKKYHHIFGRDGYPSDNGVVSVTAVAKNGAESDAYSTALFVMGKQRAIEFCNSTDGLEAVIVTDDKRVYVTDGLKQSFKLDEGNGYELEN